MLWLVSSGFEQSPASTHGRSVLGYQPGGWITPLAAAMEPGIPAFVINSSGPGTSLRRQDTFMMRNTLRFQGHGTGGRRSRHHGSQHALRLWPWPGDCGSAGHDHGQGARESKLSALPFRLRRTYRRKSCTRARRWRSGLVFPSRPGPRRPRSLPAASLPSSGDLRPPRYTVPVEESVRLINQTLKEAGHTDYQVQVWKRQGTDSPP